MAGSLRITSEKCEETIFWGEKYGCATTCASSGSPGLGFWLLGLFRGSCLCLFWLSWAGLLAPNLVPGLFLFSASWPDVHPFWACLPPPGLVLGRPWPGVLKQRGASPGLVPGLLAPDLVPGLFLFSASRPGVHPSWACLPPPGLVLGRP